MSQENPIPFAVVEAFCKGEGLHALAVVAPVPTTVPADGLDQLLADGVGDMTWLHEHRELRLNPSGLLPSARAILVVAMQYQKDGNDGELRRGRYAAGKDYHAILRPKLGRIGRLLNEQYSAAWRHRATTDSAPINERTLAVNAGLGWIGRNALVIDPERGSWQVLGTLLTEAPLAPQAGKHGADRCGSCRACETRCPTAALQGRRVISERCISYLTIEHAGVIPKALAARFEGWWFGCDLCQEVCPWNRFAPGVDDPRLRGDERDQDLLSISTDTFDTWFAGRPMRRIGYARFRRNLLVALWSLGRRADLTPLLMEGLPLVLAQAQELGLDPLPG